MRYTVEVLRPCALGNGNRQPGEVLAEIVLADGVRIEEIVNAARNGELVKFRKPAPPQPPAPESVVAVDNPVDSDSDPRSTPLEALGLAKRIAKALAAAGLHTAGAIADEGADRQGLTHLAGVSERDQEAIVAALKNLFDDEPPTDAAD